MASGLKIIPVGGGPVVTIVDGQVRGVSWGPDDVIVFSRPSPSGLFRVSANGGVAEALTDPTVDERIVNHSDPAVLPNGDAVLFTMSSFGSLDEDQIGVVSFTTGEPRRLIRGLAPRYVSTGHILFVRENALWAIGFDIDTLEVVGPPVPVLEDVRVERNSGVPQVAISDDGTLVYLVSDLDTLGNGRLVFVDRAGQVVPVSEDESYYRSPRFSPDGARIALASGAPNRGEQIWIWDIERGGGCVSRLTGGTCIRCGDQMGRRSRSPMVLAGSTRERRI